jgi:hypothetical protein
MFRASYYLYLMHLIGNVENYGYDVALMTYLMRAELKRFYLVISKLQFYQIQLYDPRDRKKHVFMDCVYWLLGDHFHVMIWLRSCMSSRLLDLEI